MLSFFLITTPKYGHDKSPYLELETDIFQLKKKKSPSSSQKQLPRQVYAFLSLRESLAFIKRVPNLRLFVSRSVGPLGLFPISITGMKDDNASINRPLGVNF